VTHADYGSFREEGKEKRGKANREGGVNLHGFGSRDWNLPREIGVPGSWVKHCRIFQIPRKKKKKKDASQKKGKRDPQRGKVKRKRSGRKKLERGRRQKDASSCKPTSSTFNVLGKKKGRGENRKRPSDKDRKRSWKRRGVREQEKRGTTGV